jgi:5-methylcytosine-specific restriction endonuclease McrA
MIKNKIYKAHCLLCGEEFIKNSNVQKFCCKKHKIQNDINKLMVKYYENIEFEKEKRKNHWKMHKEEEYKKHKEWKIKNPDKVNKYYEKADKKDKALRFKNWRIKNKGYLKLKRSKRHRDLIKTGKIEIDFVDIFEKTFDSCFYCGSKINLENDHIKPISKGGLTEMGNIIKACKGCNSSKRNKNVFEWYKSKKFFDPIQSFRLAHLIGNI